MNKQRFEALDVFKGISILFLIPLHCMMMYATKETWTDTNLGFIMQWVERGSPSFMVAMGVAFVFSKRQSFRDLIFRGIKILSIGYLLNTFKFIIPITLGIFPENLIIAHGLSPENTSGNLIHFLILGDILQLAGLSLILMAFLKPLLKYKYILLAVALGIILTSKLISGFRFGIEGIDYVLDLLWGNQYNVYFPIFPWMGFILMGRFIGEIYKENSNNAPLFFKKVFLFTGITIGLGVLLCYSNYAYHFGDYYHLGPGGMLLLLGVNVSFIYISHLIAQIIKNSDVLLFLQYASKNVTLIYFLQWVVIDWGMGIFGFAKMDQTGVLMITLLYTIVVFSMLMGINKIYKNKHVIPDKLSFQ